VNTTETAARLREAAAKIRTLSGPAAEPIAAWLESAAELHEQSMHRGQVSPGCQWCADEDWPCADMRHALALADAILAAPTAVEGASDVA
jgi:hypothetical protein